MGALQKKIVAFMFLLIVAIPLCLSIKFILEESLILMEVDEKMETVALQTIAVAKTDIVWMKKDKEIRVGDQLFDIKHTATRNDTLILTGYFDTEETVLLSEFKRYTDSNNNDNPLSKSAFKFLFSPVFNSHYEIVYGAGWLAVSNQYRSFSEMLPAPPCHAIVHPPQLLT